MKFEAFKELKENKVKDIKDVILYLATELAASLRSLRSGLGKMTFTENFESFEIDLIIPAGTEATIRNQFRDIAPRYWIAVRKNEAALSVCDGDLEWTMDFVYLKNTHATDEAVLTVIFFK